MVVIFDSPFRFENFKPDLCIRISSWCLKMQYDEA